MGKIDLIIAEAHRDRKSVGFDHTLRATSIVQLLAPIDKLWGVAEAEEKTQKEQDQRGQKKENSPVKRRLSEPELADDVSALSREDEKQKRIEDSVEKNIATILSTVLPMTRLLLECR